MTQNYSKDSNFLLLRFCFSEILISSLNSDWFLQQWPKTTKRLIYKLSSIPTKKSRWSLSAVSCFGSISATCKEKSPPTANPWKMTDFSRIVWRWKREPLSCLLPYIHLVRAPGLSPQGFRLCCKLLVYNEKEENRCRFSSFLAGGRWDSNPRHSEPQSDALTNWTTATMLVHFSNAVQR